MKKELNEVVKLKLARLLASENLTLEYANVNQPSFDPVERILLIPNWATENMDIHDVLLCNEIAHALYTPHEYNTDFEGYENKEVQIFNIIEAEVVDEYGNGRYHQKYHLQNQCPLGGVYICIACAKNGAAL